MDKTSEAANPPKRSGNAQAVADALVAIRKGDLRIISIVGGYLPDYPLLTARGGYNTRELYWSTVEDCGYRLHGILVDFQCVGAPPGNGFPCACIYDVDYIATYNTVIYNWLKRNPEKLAPFAVKDRSVGQYPEFPKQPDAVLDMPEVFTGDLAPFPSKTGESLNWLVLEHDVPLCMAVLPAGWFLEGNFVQNHASLSFPGLLWLRLRHPGKNLTVSLLKSVGARRFTDTFFSRDPKDLRIPESDEPFHSLQFMSAWQFLGIYAVPLAEALYPNCAVGDLEGETVRMGEETCLSAAGVSIRYRSADGVGMTDRISLELWDRGGCPRDGEPEENRGSGGKGRYWGIEWLVVVSKPDSVAFSLEEATVLTQGIWLSPEVQSAIAIPPERLYADSDWPENDGAGSVASRLEAARRSLTLLRLPSPSDEVAPSAYAPPPSNAMMAGSGVTPFSLANALAEMLMSGRSLYPYFAIAEWKKISGRFASESTDAQGDSP